MAAAQGGEVSSEKLGEKEFKVTIKMQGAPASAEAEEAVCTPDRKGDTIVVVSSDRMGSGNDELGKVRLAITGISSHGLACINQTEPIFDQKHTAIVKKISTILGTNAPAGKKIDLTQYENVTGDLKKNKLTITREETADLFDYITTKIYTKPAFEGIPTIGGVLLKLHDFLEAFKLIPTTITQLHILSTMITLIQSKSVQGNSLRVLDQSLPNSIGIIAPSNVLKPGAKIIQTSISGFYEKVLFTIPEE